MAHTDRALRGFIDPRTLSSLAWDAQRSELVGDPSSYAVVDGVVDFSSPRPLNANVDGPGPESIRPTAADSDDGLAPAQSIGQDTAPELQASYDRAFAAAADSGGNIYGSLDDAAAITRSGHERRMELLSAIPLGDIEQMTVVDFGTGPWGFSSIFDELRRGARCIGFDVSPKALALARAATPPEIDDKTVYATSDGEVIPLADDSVDVFFGGEVIEHVRNPALFMQEVARVCRDRALAILTTPNRDAFAYRIHGLAYCVGPEHIALLNLPEFVEVLERYSDEVDVVGYETSVGPTEDQCPVDPDLLRSVQLRSHRFPELATGLIAWSRVRKDRAAQNQQTLTMSELLWTSPSAEYSNPATPLRLFGDVDGGLLAPSSTAKFDVSGQRDLSLLMWGHDWSGMAQTTLGNDVQRHDLYSDRGGFIRIDLVNDEAVNRLTLTVLDEHSGRSNDAQVILYKLIRYAER